MMKKTLVAAAIMALGGGIGTASASNVTLYGVVDTGILFQSAGGDLNTSFGNAKLKRENTTQMASGITAGSRWGLKGVEDLGGGNSVGFVLESGFDSDNGEQGLNGRAFGREAQIYISSNDFGTLSLGRVGNLNSGNGTFGLTSELSPFGTSFGSAAANASNVMSGFDRYDNTITYRSPKFAGFNVYAQYSLDTDSNADYDGEGLHGVEGKSTVDRYYAIGATYANGPLNLAAVIDRTDYSRLKWGGEGFGKLDDSIAVTFGGNYAFEAAKVYFGAQYFKDADINSIDGLTQYSDFDEEDYLSAVLIQTKGYGFTVGADIPLAGGTFKIGTSVLDGEINKINGYDISDFGANIDVKRWNTSVGYAYALSKRTALYGVANYSYTSYDAKIATIKAELEPTVFQAGVGIVHKF